MTISVAHVTDSIDLAAVYVRPHWLWRLIFRADVRSFHAVRSPGHLGGFVWLEDKHGRVIRDPRINAALDTWRRRAAHESEAQLN